MKKAYLVLQDGTVFEGESFGADIDVIGELVFTTGMCGYIETLTDPAYYGQIVMQTFPLIGNYGIIESDFEGECHLNGYVVREWCEQPSNFRSQYDLSQFLKQNNVPAICGIDTRQLTRIIREKGVMNATICSQPPQNLKDVCNYKIVNAVENVTVQSVETFKSESTQLSVALLDLGAVNSLKHGLVAKGCDVTVYPASTTANEILSANHDGVLISGGPSDPSENTAITGQIKQLFGKTPIFAIGLGHQLLALANGAETYKLKYGHRGGNQPCRRVDGIRTYITSQNHGYAVSTDSVKSGKISFVNVNDGTVEGIEYPESNAFSVQFSPEISGGKQDTSFLFDKFIEMMGGKH